MQHRQAICIAVDGWRASALGAYGNAWQPTPALDQLASESLLFDWMIGDSPELAGFYRAVWLGRGAFPLSPDELRGTDFSQSISLPRLLKAAGIDAALTTDDQWVAEQAEAAGFAEVRCLELASPAPVEGVDETEMAKLFAVATEQIASWIGSPPRQSNAATGSAGRMLWIHSRGFHGAWDAPLALRQSLLDEDDPPAADFLIPPSMLRTTDHDELLMQRVAYAAQAMTLDDCLGGLLAALDEWRLHEETLVLAVGCRGFALGEHGVVGTKAGSLYGELLHVPCLLRLPGAMESPLPRSSALVQPLDLCRTLAEWFGASADSLPSSGLSLLTAAAAPNSLSRQFVCSFGAEGEQAIRTSQWMLRKLGASADAPAGEAAPELYAKPDDRWEANEVADRCPDVAAELLSLLALRAINADAGDRSPAPSVAYAVDETERS